VEKQALEKKALESEREKIATPEVRTRRRITGINKGGIITPLVEKPIPIVEKTVPNDTPKKKQIIITGVRQG
jgi:hypothetical protein